MGSGVRPVLIAPPNPPAAAPREARRVARAAAPEPPAGCARQEVAGRRQGGSRTRAVHRIEQGIPSPAQTSAAGRYRRNRRRDRAGQIRRQCRAGALLPEAILRAAVDRISLIVEAAEIAAFTQFFFQGSGASHDRRASAQRRSIGEVSEREAQAAAMAAAAKTLPLPEDATEAAILAKHGFVPESPTPERARTAA
ncbi:hypothetical protein [Methylorubrum thiocyanatum]